MGYEYSLKYGDSLCLLKDSWGRRAHVIKPEEPLPSKDPGEMIRRSLENPFDLPPLRLVVKEGERVAIVIPDITRYSASELYLPVVIEEVKKGGVRDKDIVIFIALGIHRSLTSSELSFLTGGLSDKYVTIQHDSDENTVFLGDTSRGTPVFVNGHLLACDRIIITGTISFHYFAGFGGGRKSLIPGLAGRETCYATHKRVLKDGGGKEPMAAPGILEGNPVHEDMLEGAGMVGVDFSINTCVTTDKKLFAIFSGSLKGAHEEGCRTYGKYFSVGIRERLPLVIASAGGYPRDINFIQSHKALDNAFQSVEKGGTIVLLARCQDGFGHPDFFAWFIHSDLESFEYALRRDYAIYGQTALSAFNKARQAKVIFVSELSKDNVERMGMVPTADLENALIEVEQDMGIPGRYYLIPEAGHVLPVITE
jgi:nickel-dependent lactate racemase